MNDTRVIFAVAIETDDAALIWDQLLQTGLFAAGPISIKVAYFGREVAPPNRPFVSTRWASDADDVYALLDHARAHCVCGCFIAVDDILAEAVRETRRGPVQAVVMMFVNDTVIVNECLREWSESTDKEKQARKDGARSFFARLQMAYVFEILEAINDIRVNKDWAAKVEACSGKTQGHFAKLCAFLDSLDYKTLTILRNNACFHYTNKWSIKAVEEIATKHPEDQSGFSQGDKLLDWYFELGDKVAQRIVVHYVFKIEEGKDIAKESDAIANGIFDAAEDIALFAKRVHSGAHEGLNGASRPAQNAALVPSRVSATRRSKAKALAAALVARQTGCAPQLLRTLQAVALARSRDRDIAHAARMLGLPGRLAPME
jgi:hypothetical protein